MATTAPAASAASSVNAPAAAPHAVETPASPRASALRVERLVVARGVEGREPRGLDTIFASNEERVFAFVEVDNPERAPGDLKVEFVGPDGRAQPPIDLAVGQSPRWRTWAFTRRAHTPGTWRAVVRDDSGRVLASAQFDVRA
jgi:hypothetical protein